MMGMRLTDRRACVGAGSDGTEGVTGDGATRGVVPEIEGAISVRPIACDDDSTIVRGNSPAPDTIVGA
jgi:hypothetical protein